MKRTISLVLVVLMVLAAAPMALADGVLLVDQPNRGITRAGDVLQVNPVIEGESQTTGLPWTGTHLPMLAQISVPNGGVSGNDQPWGIAAADVLYEAPLHKAGHTRMSALFSDTMPEDVGPVRSTRIMHAEIREEWDAGFLFFGSQKYKTSNVEDTFRETGANKKGVLFDGSAGGKNFKDFYWRVQGLAGPDNVGVNVKAIQALMPQGFTAPNRPFLFTDEKNYEGADAGSIVITQRHPDYTATFTYDGQNNVYSRTVGKENLPFVDKYTQQPLTFANLIIQRTEVSYKRNDAPMAVLVGSGNADIFIAGKYIPGYWVRDDMSSRTIFLDQNGNELKLQRGKTFVSVLDNGTEVAYN